MISLTNIICIVNLIAIIVLFIIVFMKNKENFFIDQPYGDVNMLVSDVDGNLNTFSLSKLQTDIDKMISDSVSKALKDYTTTTDTNNNINQMINNALTPYLKTVDIYKDFYDKNNMNVMLSGYVNYGKTIKIATLSSNGGMLIVGPNSGNEVKRTSNSSDYGPDNGKYANFKIIKG